MNSLLWKVYFWNPFKAFRRDQAGIGTLEVMLIIAVIVILFLIFREAIVRIINNLITNAEQDIINHSRSKQ